MNDQIETLLRQDRELIRAKINSETANLVDVALAIQQDEVEQVKNWSEAAQLDPVSDDQARRWIEEDISLWAVVVKPWVLVQLTSD